MGLTSIVICVFFALAAVSVSTGFPQEHGQAEEFPKSNALANPEPEEQRDARILGILGNWGYGYPGFGAGAYGGSCRITGRCPWYGNEYYAKYGHGHYPSYY